jgi:hypothetical protein
VIDIRIREFPYAETPGQWCVELFHFGELQVKAEGESLKDCLQHAVYEYNGSLLGVIWPEERVDFSEQHRTDF